MLIITKIRAKDNWNLDRTTKIKSNDIKSYCCNIWLQRINIWFQRRTIWLKRRCGGDNRKYLWDYRKYLWDFKIKYLNINR